MSRVDDILFAPIKSAKSRSPFVEQVWQALLDSSQHCDFEVNGHRPPSDYDNIARMVDEDPHIFRAARASGCCLDNFGKDRPSGALILKEVFERLRHNETEFWWCCKQLTNGIERYSFTNRFRVVGGCPLIGMSTGMFEPWVLGLLRKFLGFNAFYAFGKEQDAFAYWNSP